MYFIVVLLDGFPQFACARVNYVCEKPRYHNTYEHNERKHYDKCPKFLGNDAEIIKSHPDGSKQR